MRIFLNDQNMFKIIKSDYIINFKLKFQIYKYLFYAYILDDRISIIKQFNKLSKNIFMIN